MNSGGKFAITWEDGNIYAQLYSGYGYPSGKNFKSNSNEINYHATPEIAMNATGDFIIDWESSGGIYIQRYSNNGKPVMSNFQASDSNTYGAQLHPTVALANNGNCLIAWQDERNSLGMFELWDIYGQYLNNTNVLCGNNFQLNQRAAAEPIYGDIASAVDGTGNCAVAWAGIGKAIDIYVQFFNSDGKTSGENIRVNDDEGWEMQWSPKIAFNEENNFIVVWNDMRDSLITIYGQCYLNGVCSGRNFKIVNLKTGNQLNPDVKLWKNKIYCTWLKENKGDPKNYEIWVTILDWNNAVNLSEKTSKAAVQDFELCPNYPNPFNLETKIEFILHKNGTVKIEIYDLEGKKVAELLHEEKSAGIHIIPWNGKNYDGDMVTSGFYIYQIEFEGVRLSRKMLVIK